MLGWLDSHDALLACSVLLIHRDSLTYGLWSVDLLMHSRYACLTCLTRSPLCTVKGGYVYLSLVTTVRMTGEDNSQEKQISMFIEATSRQFHTVSRTLESILQEGDMVEKRTEEGLENIWKEMGYLESIVILCHIPHTSLCCWRRRVGRWLSCCGMR